MKQMGISRQEEDMEHEDRIAASYKKTRPRRVNRRIYGMSRGKRCEEHENRDVTGKK